MGEAVVEILKPYQQEQARISSDTAYLDKIAAEGALKAREMAASTLAKVKEAVGFAK